MTTGGVSADRLPKLALNSISGEGGNIVGRVLLRRSFFLFLPDVTRKGDCAAVKPDQLQPVFFAASNGAVSGRAEPFFLKKTKTKQHFHRGVAGTIHSPTLTQPLRLRRLCFHSGITAAESIETRSTFPLSVWHSRS